MASSEFLENYRLVEPTIRKLYDSSLRLAILDALKDGPMRLADLRRAVDANAPNTSSKAKELEGMGLVERERGDYKLTPFGTSVVSRLSDSIDFYTTYGKFKDFWETHHMEGIPKDFLLRLGELKNSYLVKCTKSNPIATHEELMYMLAKTEKELYAMSPVYQKEWGTELFRLTGKAKMEAILTPEILRHLAKIVTEMGILDAFEDNISFYENPETHSPPGFLTGDTFFCFSIESKAVPGNYFDMKLYSTDPKAIKWGNDLYETYKSRFKKVNLSDYL
jgi:predicted transcriptional regulator